jgi:Ca2+/Na+ antiporter
MPLCAVTDASKLCEQHSTLRQRNVAKNVDPAESAKTRERMRHKLSAIIVFAIGTSVPEVAVGLAAARTSRANGQDVPGAEPAARPTA